MFYSEITSFYENLDGIRAFIDSLEPVLIEKIEENFKRDAEDLRVLQLALSEAASENDDKKNILSEEGKRKIKENFDGDIVIGKAEDGEGVTLKVNGNGAERFEKAMKNLSKLEQQKMLLYKSTLMSIISAVEGFLADILKAYFNEYKHEITSTLISKKDKQFTMDELESFESIEDAKNFIIDSKIENLIRGSFQDWIDFLKEKLHMSMGYLNDEKDTLIEIFQRRNIIVHNKGIVNSIYLSKISEKYRKEAKNGYPIFLDREYLEDSINIIELNFSLIAFELWKSKKKNDDNRYKLLGILISKNLDVKRWKNVRGYSVFLGNDSCCSQKYRMFSKINNWLSYKRLGDFQKVKNKVLEEDFSACTLDFQVCQQALLDNKEKVFELMKEALENNILSFEDIESWPVFDEFKEDELYCKLKSEIEQDDE